MSNLSDALNDIVGVSGTAIKAIGDLIGVFADLSGAAGLFGIIESLLGDSQISLSDIYNAIQSDYQQLQAENQSSQILYRDTILSGYIAPVTTALQSLQAELDPSLAEPIVSFIQPCQTALNDLTPIVQPDLVWNLTAGWPIYWTDTGQYLSHCDYFNPQGYWIGDVGYGSQTPPDNADGLTVCYYTYSLPLFLYTVASFLAVAATLDPNYTTTYASTIKAASSLLEAKHDLIMNNGITQLSPPNWVEWGLIGMACPRGVRPGSPAPGIRVVYTPFDDGSGEFFSGAVVEYGAVEKFSGYSSVGDKYQITVSREIDNTIGDPTLFNKLQLRLLKRTKDVYGGVGLANVRNTINVLNALVGDPLLPDPSFADWSFRQVLATSQLQPTGNGYSLRALAQFIITTQPFDTPYPVPPPSNVAISFTQLLTNFSD